MKKKIKPPNFSGTFIVTSNVSDRVFVPEHFMLKVYDIKCTFLMLVSKKNCNFLRLT